MSEKEVTPASVEKKKGNKALKFFAAEGLSIATAVALEGPLGVAKALSNTVQRTIKDGMLDGFVSKWKALQDKGVLKPEQSKTDHARLCLAELLDSLDKDIPDEKRFNALQQIFFKAMTNQQQEGHDYLHHMKRLRQLSGAEILIIGASHKIMKKYGDRHSAIAQHWASSVASNSNNLLTEGIVDSYEDHLVEMKIIGERTHSDKSGINYAEYGRLAPLGRELGELLSSPDSNKP